MRKAKSNLKFLKSKIEEERVVAHDSSSKGLKSKKPWRRKQKNDRIDNKGYEI